MAECLKIFNEECGCNFTSATLAPASKPALQEFKEERLRKNPDLNIDMCTVYGGKCEHPNKLEFCDGSKLKPGLFVTLIVLFKLIFLQ